MSLLPNSLEYLGIKPLRIIPVKKSFLRLLFSSFIEKK